MIAIPKSPTVVQKLRPEQLLSFCPLHIFSAWNFLNLAKALQACSIARPYHPKAYPIEAIALANRLVAEAESIHHQWENYTLPELYRQGLAEIGASSMPYEVFLKNELSTAHLPNGISLHLERCKTLAQKGNLEQIALSFLWEPCSSLTLQKLSQTPYLRAAAKHFSSLESLRLCAINSEWVQAFLHNPQAELIVRQHRESSDRFWRTVASQVNKTSELAA